MNYSIDDNKGFAVSIFNGEQSEPILFQPDNVDGTTFASHTQADTWAKEKILELSGQSAPSVVNYALISSGVVTDIVPSTAPINTAEHDKVLIAPSGIVVGASWTEAGGFVNP